MQENDSEFITLEKFSQLVEAVPSAWAIAARAYKITILEMHERVESKSIHIIDFMSIFVKQMLLEYPHPENLPPLWERISKLGSGET